MDYSLRATVFAAILIAGSASAQQHDAERPGTYCAPDPGTLLQTTTETFRVDGKNGFDIALTNTRTNRSFQAHALFVNGPAVNTTLRYDKGALERLWPLQVGKTTSLQMWRENQAWQNSYKVERTEIITVPAGKYFSYVITEESNGAAANHYRSKATWWYAPSVCFFVRSQREIYSDNNTVRWELVRIEGNAAPVAPAAPVASPVAPPSPNPAAGKPSVEERLRELQRLRDRNVISPKEYSDRRKAILDGL